MQSSSTYCFLNYTAEINDVIYAYAYRKIGEKNHANNKN